jgi:hypothetical protein
VDTGSSKLGGEGIADDVCVVDACCMGTVSFLPAGRTAAKASMPSATLAGRVVLVIVDVVGVDSGVDLGLGDEDFDWVGVKISYFVDHFRVFSYPGHGKFLFLHCKQPGAVSSHLSFTTVSRRPDNNGKGVGPYPLEFASTTSVSGLGLLRLQVSCQHLVLSQCGHVRVQARVMRGEAWKCRTTMGSDSRCEVIGLAMRISVVRNRPFKCASAGGPFAYQTGAKIATDRTCCWCG